MVQFRGDAPAPSAKGRGHRRSRAWHRDRAANDFGLGAAQFVQVEPCLWVANLIGRRVITERLVRRGIPVTVYDHGDGQR
ncbi:hypothetical protein ACWD11_25110 [Streptomyces sp. NPDC002776]